LKSSGRAITTFRMSEASSRFSAGRSTASTGAVAWSTSGFV
jgi:hypothetical protein